VKGTKDGTREELHRGQRLALIMWEMLEAEVVVLYQDPIDVEESILERVWPE
jgi:hypothetical protein